MTFTIYARCGKLIYRKRLQLRAASVVDSVLEMDNVAVSSGSKVTEISVTSELVSARCGGEVCTSSGKRESATLFKSIESDYSPYSVSIEAGGPERRDFVGQNTSTQPGTKATIVKPNSNLQRRPTTTDTHTAAYAYTKYAVLYFIALLVTWVCLPRLSIENN